MDRWKYKCVGCGETLDVECDNCGRYLFKGRKKTDRRRKSTHLWLECVHCKYEHLQFSHRCLSTKDTTRWLTSTSLERNRDYFFKEGSSKYRVKNLWWSNLPKWVRVLIIIAYSLPVAGFVIIGFLEVIKDPLLVFFEEIISFIKVYFLGITVFSLCCLFVFTVIVINSFKEEFSDLGGSSSSNRSEANNEGE
jgi:DNA-directed RNA polymerase subunit RPC12/RpoP